VLSKRAFDEVRAVFIIAGGLALAGCAGPGAAPADAGAPAADQALDAQRQALAQTVEFLHTSARKALYDQVTDGPAADAITAAAWQKAVKTAVAETDRAHPGCVSAKVTAGKANKFDVHVECGDPSALQSADGCVELVEPTGSVSAYVADQNTNLGMQTRPVFVDTPAGAGTWSLGQCVAS
jgi:hypothetical protein